ncbi:MAG: glycosyltransferase [Candidatus Edwardsbacteria bacterium]|nr:glycosyltransferase [Candidatus Edwardsbacteria bacterium]
MSLPLVSVGVAVHNGRRHLRQTLDSLLAQTHPRLEIVISDDASSDESGEICREYAGRSPTVRYCRCAENIGATRNLNRLFWQSQGDFFFWSTQSDFWQPAYVTTCLDEMARRPDAVLCHGPTRLVDLVGRPIRIAEEPLETEESDPARRIGHLVRRMGSGNIFHGLYRSAALGRTALLRTCYGHDLLLLSELSLFGTICQHQQPLFNRRIDPAETQQQIMDRWQGMIGLGERERQIPFLTLAQGFVEMTARAPLGPVGREALLSEVISAFGARFGNELARELPVLLRIGEGISRASDLQSFDFTCYCRVFALFAFRDELPQLAAHERDRWLAILRGRGPAAAQDLLAGHVSYRIGSRVRRMLRRLRSGAGNG